MQTSTRRAVASVLVLGMLSSVVLAALVSFYASSAPDGLERVAQDEGFAASATESSTADSPLADYGFAGVEDERLGVGAAGLIGVAVTAAAAFGLFALLRPRRAPTDEA